MNYKAKKRITEVDESHELRSIYYIYIYILHLRFLRQAGTCKSFLRQAVPGHRRIGNRR